MFKGNAEDWKTVKTVTSVFACYVEWEYISYILYAFVKITEGEERIIAEVKENRKE